MIARSLEDPMEQSLKNRIAIVTGAAQGSGKGVALELARHGAIVVLADVQEQLGASVEEELRAQGLSARFCATDLSSETSVKALVESTRRWYGAIDILASCAGIYPVQDFETLTSAQWSHVITVNMSAPFWLSRECLPLLKKSGHGRIIFTTSVTGPTVVIPGLTHYAASKAGLEGFMRSLAVELAKYRINVNAVAPGAILTPGFERACTPEEVAAIAKRIPLRRLATPADIAAAYAFLASDAAEYYTGIVIRVDGGYVLPEAAALNAAV
jgi:3-oxoacyl-[acyl-carrier protein] reductase